MKLLELIKVLKDSLYNIVDNIIRYFGGADKCRTNTKCRGIRVSSTIHAAGDSCSTVVIIICDQLVNFRSGNANHDGITGGGGLFDRSTRVTNGEDHGVNLVVAQSFRLFCRFQFRCQFEIIFSPANSTHQYFHGSPLT